MKVHSEVIPETLGRALHRVNKYVKLYAPSYVEFVNDGSKADLQIIGILGLGSLPNIKIDNYAVIQYCYYTAETTDISVWGPVWSKAKVVASYLDLPEMSGYNSFNFHRMPLGADPQIFYVRPGVIKQYSILSTGYVASMECIDSAYNAVKRSPNGKMLHIGENFKYGNKYYHHVNISDDLLNQFYNASYYVAGTRRTEGFELPIIEGLLCGSRGICLDNPCYRYWYGDLVKYIKAGNYEEVSDELYNLMFNSTYDPVTKQEIELVKEKFSWETIMKKFWKEVEACL